MSQTSVQSKNKIEMVNEYSIAAKNFNEAMSNSNKVLVAEAEAMGVPAIDQMTNILSDAMNTYEADLETVVTSLKRVCEAQASKLGFGKENKAAFEEAASTVSSVLSTTFKAVKAKESSGMEENITEDSTRKYQAALDSLIEAKVPFLAALVNMRDNFKTDDSAELIQGLGSGLEKFFNQIILTVEKFNTDLKRIGVSLDEAKMQSAKSSETIKETMAGVSSALASAAENGVEL